MIPGKNFAYATLYHVLRAAISATAPFTPYLIEYLHQAFIRKYEEEASESVHLEKWPSIDGKLLDKEMWKAVEEALEAGGKDTGYT